MGPFNVTFNDFFWFSVYLVTIPPTVRIVGKILFRVAGWFFKMEEVFKPIEGKDNLIEAWLLQATRPIERLLRRQK
jgi:hypothetical protein